MFSQKALNILSEYVLHLGFAHGLTISKEYVGTFQSHYFQSILLPNLFSPSFLMCLWYVPIAIPCPVWHQLTNLPLNVLSWLVASLPWKSSVFDKIKVVLYIICQGANDRPNKQTQVFENKSALIPLALGIHT